MLSLKKSMEVAMTHTLFMQFFEKQVNKARTYAIKTFE